MTVRTPTPRNSAGSGCWRHEFGHREYVCTCDPPVDGDTGRVELSSSDPALQTTTADWYVLNRYIEEGGAS